MDENFYKNIVTNSPTGYAYYKIIYDNFHNPIDYEFVEVNDSFELFTGFSKKDVIGKTVKEIMPLVVKDNFDWIVFYGNIAKNKQVRKCEKYSLPLKGWYQVCAYTPQEGYFITLFTNINKMKKIEELLDESNVVLENIIKVAPLPLMLHAEDGDIIHLSDRWVETSGYTKKDIPTIYDWTEKAYGINNEVVVNLIKSLYDDKDKISDNEINVITKTGEFRTWDFHSKYVGKLSDGREAAMSVAVDVTERNDLMDNLMTEKQLLEITLLSVGDAVISTDKKGNITLINKVAERLTGWNQEDAIGQPIEKVFNIFHEFTNKRSANIVKNVIESGQTHELANHTVIKSLSGEIRPIEDSAAPIIDNNGDIRGVVLVFRDLSKANKAKKVLQYERDRAQMYLDVMGVILVVLDKNGNITLINKKGCEILEVTEEDVVGKSWFDNFIPKKIYKELKEYFFKLMSNELDNIDQYENVIVNSKGKEIVMSWNSSLLHDIKGNIIGVISSGTDITESKKYQESLIKLGYYDALTGIHNRRYYEENLIDYDIPENYPLTIVMADINGLKLINDAFGHHAGDELLILAADAIKSNCRDEDIVARIGGDEFVMVLPNTTEAEAEVLINNINNKTNKITVESINLSISFGFKTKVKVNEDIEEIYRSAEDLMYREKLLEIPSMRSGAIETILSTLYEKDKSSEIHSRTVSILSENIAREYGMNRQDVAKVKTAGLLHDIGKIIISLSILKKHGKLTDSEYATMKTHSEIGFRILNSTQDMRSISNVVLNHHERWDGKGYPRGIKSDDIPVPSRIIAIADAFDAMTSERTYRDMVSKEEALQEIILNSGTQFDPELVKVFKNSFDIITQDI